jgi:serine/threonine-protein kinase
MLKPGDEFERYTIEALIGQGGMGAVYRAHDKVLGRRVALKVMNDGGASAVRRPGLRPDEPGYAPDPEANARLLREARAAAALDHPNAVAIFDVGVHDGAPYIVMELVEGRTMRTLVGDAETPLPARLARLADVARALAGAHKRGLVHRDVKPENIMVRDDGMVKVLDFGIARSTRTEIDPHASTQSPALATLTVEGVKLGTPVYMAPEQIRGDSLDGRADQFAWGVLAYETLAGRLPWRGAGDALAVMASILTDPVDERALADAGVPEAVRAIVLRALSKRPGERFASMDEVAEALAAAARGEAIAAPAKKAESATEAQQFSTDQVRDVLARAVEQQAAKQGTKLRFEDLLAVAAEVGVDEESLREASRALRKRNDDEAAPVPAPAAEAEASKLEQWKRRKRRAFFRHAGVFVIVNSALVLTGLVALSFLPMWIFLLPAIAWGIGLAIHGMVALSANEDDFAEENERMRWWREARDRRYEVAMARSAERGARGRNRVESVAAPRMRVAEPTGGDTARVAEEEAAIAEVEQERQRRRR